MLKKDYYASKQLQQLAVAAFDFTKYASWTFLFLHVEQFFSDVNISMLC